MLRTCAHRARFAVPRYVSSSFVKGLVRSPSLARTAPLALPRLDARARHLRSFSSPVFNGGQPASGIDSGEQSNPSVLVNDRGTGEAVQDPELDAGLPVAGTTALDETVPDHLSPAGFVRLLEKHGMDFFTGVPDSLLKDFAGFVSHTVPKRRHVITANEGNSVAVAAGYHMATGKIPVVYMQNSGIGNAVNPLMSLCARRVYSVPMLVLVGWRGEPGRRDEPQHVEQGKVLPAFLTSLGITYDVLPDWSEGIEESVTLAVEAMQKRSAPHVFLVRKNTFTQFKPQFLPSEIEYPMLREAVLTQVIDALGPRDATVATTGFTSRELYEVRQKRDQVIGRDFLMVGSMGHATAFALGVALFQPNRRIICLDGDGAMLMHTGTMATIGKYAKKLPNFKHILINNGAHDSVGGQATGAFKLNVEHLASGFGYAGYRLATTPEQLDESMKWLLETPGPVLLEVRCTTGARKDLGRPKSSTHENKAAYMKFLADYEL